MRSLDPRVSPFPFQLRSRSPSLQLRRVAVVGLRLPIVGTGVVLPAAASVWTYRVAFAT